MSPPPSERPFFSIIIVSLNGASVIARALDAVLADGYPRREVIVVDNGSTDRLGEIVLGYPDVRLLQSPVNLGFAGGNNLGIREARGDILVLLNDDTEVRAGWLEAWAAAAERHPRWGVFGAKLLYPDGRTVQHAGGRLDANALTHHLGYEEPDDGRFDAETECDYVTGAALAVRREALEAVGPLDEGYFPIYFEEVDYCWQIRHRGWEVLYVPGAVVIHHESRTQARYSFRFLVRYNTGRLRFLVKCLPGRELLRAARTELRWWFRRYSFRLYAPMLRAYAHALVRLPGWLALRRRFRSGLPDRPRGL